MKQWKIIVAGAVAVLAACTSGQQVAGERTAFTSIVTHKYFAERIAGDRYAVHTLIDANTDAHSFNPRPAQMTALSRAQLFFRAGVEFESGILPDIVSSNKALRVVDLHEGIATRAVGEVEDEDHHHNHGATCGEEDGHEGHHHDHGATDPHAWMAPQAVKLQAARIRDAFKAADPAFAARYDSAYGAVAAELDSLDAELKNILAGLEGRELFVFHPAFGYFADAYGLKQVAVETGGKEPGAKALARLIDEVTEKQIRVLFVQPQYPQQSVQAIARQTGCAVMPVSSMPEDYMKEMLKLGKAVAEGLK